MGGIPNDYERGHTAGFASGQESRAKEIVGLKRRLQRSKKQAERLRDIFADYDGVEFAVLYELLDELDLDVNTP